MASLKPILQAFLLADHVYVDKVTGKKVVAGIFHRLNTTSFPAVLPVTWTYASIVGAPGAFTIQLRLVDLGTQEVVAESAVIEANHGAGRLEPHEIVLPIPALQFDKPGAFDFELIIDGETLKGCRFTVMPTAAGGSKDGNDRPKAS